MPSLSPPAGFLPHTNVSTGKGHPCHLWILSSPPRPPAPPPPHRDILSQNSYSYPGTHARKFHRLNTSTQALPPTAHCHSYTYCPKSRKHAAPPTRLAHLVGPQSAGPGGLLTSRERAGSRVRAAAGGGRTQLGLQRPGQPRGRPPPCAPAPLSPSPPTPRRPQDLPRQRAPCQASVPVPCQPPPPESPPGLGLEAILVPPRWRLSLSGLRGALEWGRGQAELEPGSPRDPAGGTREPMRQGCPRVPRRPTSGEGKGRRGERFPWS